MGLMVFAFLAAFAAGTAPEPAVDQIMARVAENQSRSLELRRAYVYRQHLLLRFHRAGGRLAREESHDYLVLPAEKTCRKELVRFQGKYERGGQYFSYDQPGYEYKGLDIDGDLMRDFAQEMANDQGSRDGIGTDLFPLTAGEQRKYTFTLAGREKYRESDVYRVRFEPRKGDDSSSWAGEALIDAQEFQPILIHSRLAMHIPLFVKTVLGTDIKGLGFSISYRRFDGEVWFPVSYGGEFQVRGVFFYRRTMSVSLENFGFERADVASRITYRTEDH